MHWASFGTCIQYELGSIDREWTREYGTGAVPTFFRIFARCSQGVLASYSPSLIVEAANGT